MKVKTEKKESKHVAAKIILCVFLTLYFILSAAMALSIYMVQKERALLGYGCYSVTTDKSADKDGSLVIAKRVYPSDVNMKIVFSLEDGNIATGISESEEDNSVTVATASGSAEVAKDKVYGQVVLVLPFVGYAAQTLNLTLFIVCAIAVPVFVLLVVQIAVFVKLIKEEKSEQDDDDEKKYTDEFATNIEEVKIPLYDESAKEKIVQNELIDSTLEFEPIKEESPKVEVKPEFTVKPEISIKEEKMPEYYNVDNVLVIPQNDGFILDIGEADISGIKNVKVRVKNGIASAAIETESDNIDFTFAKDEHGRGKTIIQQNTKSLQ